MPTIAPGDVVEALKNGGRDKHGRPSVVPIKGQLYRVTSVYPMRYGLGCTLAGLNPSPYRGFLLYVNPSQTFADTGWYFAKAGADKEFTELMRGLVVEKRIARPEDVLAMDVSLLSS